jgi:hypothetical protein
MAKQTFRLGDEALIADAVSPELRVAVVGESRAKSREIVLLRESSYQVVSSATDRLDDVYEAWIAALKDGEDLNTVSVQFAQDLVMGGSQQLRAVGQCVVSYEMAEIVLAFKPPKSSAADIAKNPDLKEQVALWSSITEAGKAITHKMVDTLRDASTLSLRLCSLHGALARFYEMGKAGMPFEAILPQITKEVTKFVTFSDEMERSLAAAHQETNDILDRLVDGMAGVSSAKELRVQIKELHERSEKFIKEQRDLRMELCDANKNAAKWGAELAVEEAIVANAELMIQIADGAILNAKAAEAKHRELSLFQTEKSKEGIHTVTSEWKVPIYETTYSYDYVGYESSWFGLKRTCKGCRSTWSSCRCKVQNVSGQREIGSETKIKVTVDDTEYRARQRAAEEAKAFADEFAKNQVRAVAEKDSFVLIKKASTKKCDVLKGKIEAHKLAVDQHVKATTEKIARSQKELEDTHRKLDQLKAQSGVSEQKMVEFGTVMVNFKQSMICCQASTADQKNKVIGFVGNLQASFSIEGLAKRASEEKEDDDDEDVLSVRKPKFIETKAPVRKALDEEFGSLEDDDMRLEEDEWYQDHDDTFAKAGLNNGQVARLKKWLMRDVLEKKAAAAAKAGKKVAKRTAAAEAAAEAEKSEFTEEQKTYIIRIVRPLIGFLGLFRAAADKTSRMVGIGSRDYAEAKEQILAGAESKAIKAP